MGQSLNLHPMIVSIAAVAGVRVAGVLGLLLGARVLAGARLRFIYIYRKLNDLNPFPEDSTEVPHQTAEHLPESIQGTDGETVQKSRIGWQS